VRFSHRILLTRSIHQPKTGPNHGRRLLYRSRIERLPKADAIVLNLWLLAT